MTHKYAKVQLFVMCEAASTWWSGPMEISVTRRL